MQPSSRLKIGYLWQSDQSEMDKHLATNLHVQAVVQRLQAHEHTVRMVAIPDGKHKWSDDLKNWRTARLGASFEKPWFPPLESAVRRLQSTLHLPYINLFDSQRYAEACMSSLIGFDVLYERYWMMNYGGAFASRRLGIPLVLEVNGDIYEEYAQLGIKLSPPQWLAIDQVNRFIFHNAAHVIAVSEPLRQRLIKRWRLPEAKISTVHNGADLSLFVAPEIPANLPAFLRFLEEEPTTPIITFVGSFKPWHGIDLLLEAFKQVSEQFPNARLMLVGDGPLRTEIEMQVSALRLSSRVIFTGRVRHQDVPFLLRLSQIAVLAPRPSGASISQSPLKLFEYMAVGKAIVAPATPNVEEVLTHDVNGLLTAPNDADALARAFLRLLGDEELRRQLGSAAQREAVAKYSWNTTVAQIESILYQVIQTSATAPATTPTYAPIIDEKKHECA